MADYLINEKTLTDIGDAVRAKKNGSSNKIPVDKLANEISSIGANCDVTPDDLLDGVIAYDGTKEISGNIPVKSASDLSANGATVTVPAGYYETNVSKAVAPGKIMMSPLNIDIGPLIGITVDSSSGKITASAEKNSTITPTLQAGYIDSVPTGTIKVAGTTTRSPMNTKPATTYTPGTSNQTIAKGTYLTGDQTIKGDVDLVPEHIRYGKEIFGVYGTCGDIKSRTVTARVLDQTFPNPTNAFAYYTATSASTWNIQINGTTVWSTSSTNTNLKIICVGSWLIITNNAADRLVLFTDNIDYPIQSVRISSNISINHALYYIS